MPEDQRHQAIEWLRDWSKWLISVNVAAVTGCTVVLQMGVKGPPRPFLLLAIAAFSLSVIISMVVVRALSTAAEIDAAGQERRSVLDHPVVRGVSVRAATRLQLLTLIAGVLFFLAWVLLKPAPPPAASASASAFVAPCGATGSPPIRST